MRKMSLTLRCWLPALPLVVVVATACGGSTEPRSGEPDAGANFTIVNGVKCCVEGIGEECCAGARSEPNSCGQYGGPVGHCAVAGEAFATKVDCAICCPGLHPISISHPENGSCSFGGLDSRICAACGDGVCDADAHENVCNCPEDCR